MYNIIIRRAARKAVAQLPDVDAARVLAVIQALETEPRPPGCIKLSGSPFWRIRTGVYRVIYEINDQQRVVTVNAIGHRRDVYRS